jgi:hypothetical protein
MGNIDQLTSSDIQEDLIIQQKCCVEIKYRMIEYLFATLKIQTADALEK